MAGTSEQQSSNSHLLQELDSLSKSLYPSRRTASLALSRPSEPPLPTGDATVTRADHQSRSHRISLSPWRNHPTKGGGGRVENGTEDSPGDAVAPSIESTGKKKGIWSWKPMRALSHIAMRRLGCLFSMEVASIRGLPTSMNGLRLSVAIRKKETKDGAVHTMPSRVLQGSADFAETLFIRCHVYCTGGGGSGKPLKLEAREFVVSVVAIDVPELELGKDTVDLSLLIRESVERSLEGMRIRQWDKVLKLSGKAMGGELVLKLGFQIMEDGGVGIYNEPGGFSDKGKGSSFFNARKQSKSSFSVASARFVPAAVPSKEVTATHSMRMEFLNLDDPEFPHSSSPSYQNSELELNTREQDFPDFEVVDKGVEVQTIQTVKEKLELEESAEKSSVSGLTVKEIVSDHPQKMNRLMELDSIEKQIKALELTVHEDRKRENKIQQLDSDEETVTREFLQMLDLKHGKELQPDTPSRISSVKSEAEKYSNNEEGVFLSDLGESIGAVIQTRDGGHLISINPFDVEVLRKETPKLAMQISRPFILQDQKLASGFEAFQRLAAMGSERMASKLLSLAAMDELMGKTAEQIAFEGVASAIISKRHKEHASSSAARSILLAKTMATAMSEGRKERILTGIWNMREEPVPLEETLAVSLQKIEAMVVEAVKIQADIAEEEAPFVISPHIRKEDHSSPLDSAILLDDWEDSSNYNTVTTLVIIQLRDPLRRYEAVGAPMIAVLQAARVDAYGEEEEDKFKMTSLHVGGLKLRLGGMISNWDGEKQRLTAMQWLVAYGMGKPRKKNKLLEKKAGQDFLWSISSRVLADMWLNSIRNIDVKVPSEYQM